MVVVQDLVARFRSEGIQETAQQLRSVGQEAQVAARALEITAEKLAKVQGGSVADSLEQLRRSGAQPVASALAQAAREMENTAAAASKAVQPTQAMAKAAADHADGWKLSESQVTRFGAGLIGVGLGLSLVAGTAKLVHDTVAATVGAQLDWERSIVRSRIAFGGMASEAIAAARAQATLPGASGSAQEFAEANLQAAYLTNRYGLSPMTVRGLTSAADRAGTALAFDDRARRDLQARALAFVEGGGSSLREFNIEGDPEAIARQIGLPSAAGLQVLTPSELRNVGARIATIGLNRAAIEGTTDQPGLLRRRAELERLQSAARTATQVALEGQGQIGPSERDVLMSLPGAEAQLGQSGFSSGFVNRVDELQKQIDEAGKAIEDHRNSIEEDTKALGKMGFELGGAAIRLATFTGSLEDRYSIARGDVAAQAMGAVAARGRMAIPSFGTLQSEITFQATNTAWQNAWQNFTARLGFDQQGNSIREELERRVQFGPANQRPAAQRALDEARASEPVQQRLGEAGKAAALVDLATAETQSKLEAITLTQRERYVQLMRDTVDLRKLDNQQQQAGLAASMEVTRAQQRALPAQYALADANYATTRASVLAQAYVARRIQGKDVSDLPSIGALINMNVAGQLAAAEAGPGALQGARAIELAQRTATSAGLAQQLTGGQIRSAELANDLKNLGDLPSQTALMLEDVQNNRDHLAVAKEQRDLQKDLIRIVSGGSPSATSGQALDELIIRVAAAVLGGGSGGNLPAMPELPGARRGPS